MNTTRRLFSRLRKRASSLQVLGLLLGISALAGLFVLAQDDADYPHGDFSEDCALCHGDAGWKPVRISKSFDHQAISGFAREGAHEGVECRDCHLDLDFTKADSACVSCHQDIHRGEFGIDCSRCHTTETFIDRGDQLRLHRGTRFPLAGAHLTLDCERCHQATAVDTMEFVGTPTGCENCHLDQYQATTSPDHQASGFSTNCVLCHATTTWDRARFDHSASGFPLEGAHKSLDCSDCHAGGKPGGGGVVGCYDCHQKDYEGVSDPNHLALAFPRNCEQCHGGSSWTPADFDHDRSAFPLTGAHRSLNCSDCHADNVYRGKSADCYSCHQQNYEGTTSPDHRSAGYSTDCMNCHNTSNWGDANFDHNASDFPLTGAHQGLDCAACHSDGVYDGKPTDCYSCHSQDYDATNDPNHRAAGFPTDCTQCHNTSTWDGAEFDHDGQYFPIYSGSHRGRWTSCTDCHFDPQNYGEFSCLDCHEHRQSEMDSQHSDVSGYRYDSNACYQCHPDGRE